MYLQQLSTDHTNAYRLLNLLEKEMSVFDKGDHPNFGLMQDIIDYMGEYTEKIHHPLEDLAYKKLIEKKPSFKKDVDELLNEHQELEQLTKQFCLTLEEIVLESVMPRDAVSRQGHDYIDKNRNHLQKEEQKILPEIAESLKDEDWKEIEPSIVKQDDPLFGKNIKDKYQALYKQIITDTTV